MQSSFYQTLIGQTTVYLVVRTTLHVSGLEMDNSELSAWLSRTGAGSAHFTGFFVRQSKRMRPPDANSNNVPKCAKSCSVMLSPQSTYFTVRGQSYFSRLPKY
jgi:hypothetical protein